MPPATTSPRKKQAANLVLLASVQGSDTKQQKKGRRPLESSVGGKRSRSVAGSDTGPADQTAGLELIGVVTARSSIHKDEIPSPLKKKKQLKKKRAAAPAVSDTTVVDVPPSLPVEPNGPVMSDSPPRTPSPVHSHSLKTSSPLHTSPTLRKSQSSSCPFPPDASTTCPIARAISPELVDPSFRRLTPNELSTQRRGPNSSRDESHTSNAWDNFPSMDVDDETGDLLVGAGIQAGISEPRNITKGRLILWEASSSATPPELEQDDRTSDEVESDDVDMPEEQCEEEWEKWSDYNAYISHNSDKDKAMEGRGLEAYFTSHSEVNATAHGLSEVLHLERAPSSFPKSFQFLYPSDTLHIQTQAGDFGLPSSDVTSLPAIANVSVHSPIPVRPRLPSPFRVLSNHDSSSGSGSESSEEDEAEIVKRLLGLHGENAD